MTLSDLASIGSLVSGVAVLVSLIYLSLQVKQAERNQQAAIRASRASRIVDIMMGCTEPSLAEAISKGMSGAEDMSDAQIQQFMSFSVARFINAEDSFYQFKEGLLGEFTFDSVANGVRVSFASRGLRAIYKRQRGMFGKEFVEFADKLLAEAPIALPVSLSVQWKADMAAERSV